MLYALLTSGLAIIACACLCFVNPQQQGGGAAEARAALSDKGGTVLPLLKYTRSRDLQATLKRMPPVKQPGTATATAASSALIDSSSGDAASVQHSTAGATDKAAERNGNVQSVVVDRSSGNSKQAQSSTGVAMRALLSRSKQRRRSSSNNNAKIAAA
jgi:hypothetical protein